MEEFASSPLLINLSHVTKACHEDWQSFLDDNQLDPVPERQDLRGFLLNWIAIFIPEAFPQTLLPEMANWFVEQTETGDPVLRFVRPGLIGATLFAMTADEYYLQCQTENFAYGGSQIRSFLQRSLALVAPRMAFDEGLVSQLDRGMKVPYFFMSTPLALYAVSQGDVAGKVANLKKWKDSYRMNIAEQRIVDGFLAGESVENPLQSWLHRNTIYVMLRLGCHSRSRHEDTDLPSSLSLSEVWDRIHSHPLFSTYVELRRTAHEDKALRSVPSSAQRKQSDRRPASADVPELGEEVATISFGLVDALRKKSELFKLLGMLLLYWNVLRNGTVPCKLMDRAD